MSHENPPCYGSRGRRNRHEQLGKARTYEMIGIEQAVVTKHISYQSREQEPYPRGGRSWRGGSGLPVKAKSKTAIMDILRIMRHTLTTLAPKRFVATSLNSALAVHKVATMSERDSPKIGDGGEYRHWFTEI